MSADTFAAACCRCCHCVAVFQSDWTREKADAFDIIISQHGPDSRSIPFASALSLKGPQTFCCVTQDEEGLAIDLKNGFVERLKAIQFQLDAMSK